jgi:hypothetical protein
VCVLLCNFKIASRAIIACGFGRMNESGLRFCDDGIELDRKKRSSRDNRGSVFRSRKMGGIWRLTGDKKERGERQKNIPCSFCLQ